MVDLSSAPWTKFGGVRGGLISRRLLEPDDPWLIPVVGPDDGFQVRGPCSPRPRWRGVNHCNLLPLCRTPRTADTADPPVPARLGLVNARSLANKTFILKDLFTSRELDFLFVTEMWMTVGESSTFTELLPHDCCYFNSPRMSGRGGGTAIVFKSFYKCKLQSPSSSFTSFELYLCWVTLTLYCVPWSIDLRGTTRTS